MDSELVDLVNQEDDLQIAIRCHLVVEHFLVKIIQVKLPISNEFSPSRLTFRQKVELCVALDGIRREKKGVLLYINKLRNKYAHDMGHKVSEQDIQELYSLLDADDRDALAITSYDELGPEGKLGGHFLILYGYLNEEYEYHLELSLIHI